MLIKLFQISFFCSGKLGLFYAGKMETSQALPHSIHKRDKECISLIYFHRNTTLFFVSGWKHCLMSEKYITKMSGICDW